VLEDPTVTKEIKFPETYEDWLDRKGLYWLPWFIYTVISEESNNKKNEKNI
jgi:hypothetical protein